MLCSFPQLSSLTKETSQSVSPGQKTEGKEEGDLKEEEKKETSDAPSTEDKKEESKEDAKQDTEVKEEKSGTNRWKETWQVGQVESLQA